MLKKLLLMLLSLSITLLVGCGGEDEPTDTEDAAPADLISSALTLMPKVGDATVGLVGKSRAICDGWSDDCTTTPKESYRNDIAFNVLMRFMEDNDATEAAIGQTPGSESLRNVLETSKTMAYDFIAFGEGTHETEFEGLTFTITNTHKTPNDDTVVPFDFVGVTPTTTFDFLQKSVVPLPAEYGGGEMSAYGAWRESSENSFLLASYSSLSSGSSEGDGIQGTTVYAEYNEFNENLKLYSASRSAYENDSRFITRLDFEGNMESKEFTFKSILRDSNGGTGVGQSFSMVAKGVNNGADTWSAIKVRYCSDSDQGTTCQASATDRWFCVRSDVNMDDIKEFIATTDGNNHTATYTDTTKIKATPASFTGDCLTYKTELEDETLLTTSATDLPDLASNTEHGTYFSTLGFE